jgi:hypothetical protein
VKVAVANVPIVGGSVEIDAGSQVRRSLDITLGAAVDVYGSEIAVFRGSSSPTARRAGAARRVPRRPAGERRDAASCRCM